MKIAPLLIGCVIAGAHISAYALDVASFEQLHRQQSGADRVEARFASLSLSFYFAGIADMLNGVKSDTGELYYAGPRKVCLPVGVVLNGKILDAMTQQEVRMAEASKALKPNWKESNINLFVFVALARNYPCEK